MRLEHVFDQRPDIERLKHAPHTSNEQLTVVEGAQRPRAPSGTLQRWPSGLDTASHIAQPDVTDKPDPEIGVRDTRPRDQVVPLNIAAVKRRQQTYATLSRELS